MKNYDLVIHPTSDTPLRRVELHGCLDSHTVVPFERTLQGVLEDKPQEGTCSSMVLDLSKLTYISSAGISALMGLTRRLRERECELYLLKPTDKVYRVFRTLGFTNIFRIISDETEATQPRPTNARQS